MATKLAAVEIQKKKKKKKKKKASGEAKKEPGETK